MTDREGADDELHYHLVRAARVAIRQGVTKKQFMAGADVFWDSCEKMHKFMAREAPRISARRGKESPTDQKDQAND